MALKPLSSADVRVGEVLAWPVYDRQGHLLLRQGSVVASEWQRDGLLDRGFVQTGAGATRERERDALAAAGRETSETGFDRVAMLATELHGIHLALLGEHPRGAAARIADLAVRLQSELRHDTDATLAALQIAAAHESGFAERHLHAAALCDVLGRALGHAPAQRQALLCAGLSFDIGLRDLAATLDRQSTPLSAVQRAELHRHPDDGVARLRDGGIDDATWLDAVAQHHERIDGSGYPHGLAGDAIGIGGRMLAIADIYSAMIRPRAYRGAMQAKQALRDIFLERGRQVDEALAALLVRELGIYPPGTFVRLQNGEVAVVTRRQQNAAHPSMKCVVATDGTPLVRAVARDSRRNGWAIVEVVPASAYRSVLGGLHALWSGRDEPLASEPA